MKWSFISSCIFGPNTFTNKEWGEGTEPEDIFNPTNLDCHQWCRIARAAGAKRNYHSLPSIMMDFVCGRVNIQRIQLGKVNGKTGS
jgi:hypothetical protein